MRGSVLQQAAFAGVAGDDAVPFLAHRGSSGIGSGKGVALMGVGGSYVAGGDAELAKIAGS